MKTKFNYAIAILMLASFVSAFAQKKENPPVSPMEGMNKFIGEWVIPKEALEEFPKEQRESMAKMAIFTFKWADENKTLKMFEMHPKGNTDDATLEALAALNPVTKKIKFIGLNQVEDFFFEGEFIFDGSNKLYRLYDVYYPADYSWAKQGVHSMKFRDTYTLRDDGKIEQVVDFYSTEGQKWGSFTGGKTFLLEKVGS